MTVPGSMCFVIIPSNVALACVISMKASFERVSIPPTSQLSRILLSYYISFSRWMSYWFGRLCWVIRFFVVPLSRYDSTTISLKHWSHCVIVFQLTHNVKLFSLPRLSTNITDARTIKFLELLRHSKKVQVKRAQSGSERVSMRESTTKHLVLH